MLLKNKIYSAVIMFAGMMSVTPLAVMANSFTLVIDAGHGGKDKGALGQNIYEKDVNLAVALRLGKMVKENLNDVNVVYTRDDDTFVELYQRAKIANESKGNLFISIHCNSVPKKSKNRNTINGASTYVLGLHKSENNLEVAMRENSVVELEADYSVNYRGFDPNSSESYIIFEIAQQQYLSSSIEFAQHVQEQMHSVADRTDIGVKQAGFLVLSATSMPAVLVELDFICNPTVEKYFASDKGKGEMAEAIFNAVKMYKESLDNRELALHESIAAENKKQEVENNTVEEHNAVAETKYKVLYVLSSTELKSSDKKFKGIEPTGVYRIDGQYGYTVGDESSEAEVGTLLKEVKKKFKQASIVAVVDNDIVNYENK